MNSFILHPRVYLRSSACVWGACTDQRGLFYLFGPWWDELDINRESEAQVDFLSMAYYIWLCRLCLLGHFPSNQPPPVSSFVFPAMFSSHFWVSSKAIRVCLLIESIIIQLPAVFPWGRSSDAADKHRCRKRLEVFGCRMIIAIYCQALVHIVLSNYELLLIRVVAIRLIDCFSSSSLLGWAK